MNPAASLYASADLAETRGRHALAGFYRDMARDAQSLPSLYHNWAKQAAEYVMKEQGR